MKKRILSFLGAAVLSLSLLAGCAQDSEEKTAAPESTPAEETEQKELVKVTLNEVAHSIFYAPMYVAVEEGYFQEEGIDLTLVCGFGADKTMTAVISGEADIGFMGSEASIYTYAEGATDYVVNFCSAYTAGRQFSCSPGRNARFHMGRLKRASCPWRAKRRDA